MARKKRQQRTKQAKPKRFFQKLKEEEQEIYNVCVHPLACHFDSWTFLWHKRIGTSLFFAVIMAFFSQMYPICTQSMCYRYFIQLVLAPSLWFKPFTLDLVVMPFMFTVAFFGVMWFVILTFFSWLQKRRWLPEVFLPSITILLLIYLVFMTSGSLTPLALELGAVDCVTSDDCIRAGYVGEVCTSVYKHAYTTYSTGIKPLEKCVCMNNRCIGS
jgi:glucan phosphoethanolaminetransferase (alkaline phosphatase superfamily)